MLSDIDVIHLMQLNHTAVQYYRQVHPYTLKHLVCLQTANLLLLGTSGPLRIVQLRCKEANNRYDSNAAAIATALQHNTSLQKLDLTDNKMSAVGARALATSLQHNTSLQTLVLNWNEIDDDGATAIAVVLQHNMSLLQVELEGNNIGNDGTAAIAVALQHNTSLQELNKQ